MNYPHDQAERTIGYGAANQPQKAEMPPVPEALNRNADRLQGLREALNRLQDRLEPSLRPVPPSPGVDQVKPAELPQSTHHDTVLDHGRQISDMIVQVDSMTNRLTV